MGNKTILILIVSITILMLGLSLTSATIQTHQPVKQDTCINITNPCANCSYVQLNTVESPSNVIYNVSQSLGTNGASPYNFCNTSVLGQYIVNTEADGQVYPFDFYVTPSGAELISPGQSNILFFAVITILAITILFFILGFKSENIAGKAIFFSIASIMTLILILYTILTLNENIATSPTLVEGFSTFYFVMRMIGLLGFVGLMVVVFLVMLKAWKIKRGLID